MSAEMKILHSPEVPPIPHPVQAPNHLGDFYLRMMEAIAKAGETSAAVQIEDSKSTIIAAQLEEAVYKAWNDGTLKADVAEIQKLVEEIKNCNDSDKRQALQNELTAAQSKYSLDQTRSQSAENEADRGVQAQQTITSQISSFMQQIAQLASSASQMMSMLANFLAR